MPEPATLAMLGFGIVFLTVSLAIDPRTRSVDRLSRASHTRRSGFRQQPLSFC
jgi:hypothetical protein